MKIDAKDLGDLMINLPSINEVIQKEYQKIQLANLTKRFNSNE